MRKNKIILISTESPALNGLRIISSLLKKNSFSVRLITLSTFSDTLSKSILRQVLALSKDSLLVGVSCMANTSKKILQLIQYLKKYLPNTLIVWGGIHATLNPEDCIRYADIVCIGEGEQAILELACAIRENRNITEIENLWIKKGCSVYKNKVRSLINNLNSLPFPDYNFEDQYILINNKIKKNEEEHMAYGSHNASNLLLIVAESFITCHTVRGCLYNCDFCCNHDLKMLYEDENEFIRKKDIHNIIYELVGLKKKFKSLKFVWFTDDDFFIRSYEELSRFSKLYKEKINLPFMCYVNPLTFNEDKLKVLLDAGLYILEMGIQSGSPDFSKKMYNRKCETSLILNIAQILKKYETKMFPIVYQMMYMNPFEKEEDVLKSIELLRTLPKPFFLKPFCAVFFPGSFMYKKAVKFLRPDIKINEIYTHNYMDYFSHAKLKQKNNLYLNLIIRYMEGLNTKSRAGKLPKPLFRLLMYKKVRGLCKKSHFLNSIMLYFPTKENILWMLPSKYKDKYLNMMVTIFTKIYKTKAAFKKLSFQKYT